MGFVELIRIAARNLWCKKGRTVWTMTGVVIGALCMILAGAFAISSHLHFEKELLGTPAWMEIEVSVSSANSLSNMKMTEADIINFLEIEGVERVTPTLRFPAYLLAGEYEAGSVDLIAVEPGFYNFRFKDGGSFDPDSAMPQIVMGYDAQNSFISEKDRGKKEGNEEKLGEALNEANRKVTFSKDEKDLSLPFDYNTQTIRLYLGSKANFIKTSGEMTKSKQYNAIIAGILEKTQDERNNSFFISLNAAKKIIRENIKLAKSLNITLSEYNTARIKAANIRNVSKIVKMLEDMGFQADAKGEVIESAQKEQERQQRQLLLIGLITLFVSTISIANMMQTSILERRHEIGIMKVTGLALIKIYQIFLVEAAMIGFIGGIAGTAISYTAVFFADNSTGRTQISGMYLSEGARLIIPFWLPLAVIAIAIIIGTLAGIYPACKAIKMSPADALRG